MRLMKRAVLVFGAWTAVATHVAMLRRKLEHDPAHPRHIVTMRTFGYRIER